MSEDAPSFQGDVTVRSIYWSRVVLWIVAVVGGSSLLFLRALEGAVSLGVFAFFGLVFGLGSGWKLFSRKKKERDARALIDARGLFLDGKLALRKDELKEGTYLRPLEHGRTGVVIPSLSEFRSLDLGVASEAEGMAVLAALGQDPARAKVRFRLAAGFENRTLRRLATFVIGLSTSFGVIVNGNREVFYVLGFLWSIAILFAGVSFLVPTYVTVGADGLFVERRGRSRFLPFVKIASIETHRTYPDAVVVTLDGGEEVTLRTSIQDKASLAEKDRVDQRALLARARASLEAFRAGTHGGDVAFFLKRGGRSAKDWMESLENLRLERGYRETHLSDDQLWAVLEDPAASPEERAAALIALRGGVDEEGKVRRRIALEASAEPRLRVVLTAAEKDDPAALEAALDELQEKSEAEKS